MPQLYDDTGSLQVCGYAAVFGVTYSNGGQLERVAPGAFQFPGSVRLDFDHQGRSLASTDRGSLKLWQDDYGLAFQATLRSDWTTLSLMHAVRRGTFRGASFQSDGKAVVEAVEESGRDVNVIRRLDVGEISIATAGANPSAACWLDDETGDELPAGIASARARWQVGRMGRHLAAHQVKPRGKARPSAAVMASVDRVLAMAAGTRR